MSSATYTSPETSCIILLHGLNRTHNSLKKMASTLEAEGYKVWNHTYPSRDKPIDELAKMAIEPALAFCEKENIRTIHFVTHSLGGILVRYYLQDHQIDSLGRIVMLSPPNKGTEIVDELKNLKLFQFINGPAAQQLGTEQDSLPNRLKPIAGEIGVIIGNFSSDPWFSWFILPGEDDGKVTVARARLEEMTDFLVVRYGHTFIMQKDHVIKQVKTFLRHGAFAVEEAVRK